MNQIQEVLIAATDWTEDFKSTLVYQGVSSSSVKSYIQDIRHFATWFELVNGQPFDPSLITGVDLRSYRSEALENKVSPATFNRRRASLRRLVQYLMQSGLLSYDPFQGIDVMEEEEKPPRWLNETEVHRLLRQVELMVNGASSEHWKWQAARDQAMIMLMLFAGLREAEVAALDWEDVQISERKGKVIVRRGKGDKKREVPLNAEARRAIIFWKQLQGDQSAMFVGKGGERVSTRLVQKRVEALRQAAGLDKTVTPHALRHTFAKRLLDGGAPLTVVGKLLGHARLDTTARYVQPGWNDFEKAVETL
jgi:integrase/recombinase XerC